LIEDAATGSASSCLQAFLLKYHTPVIEIINNQGDLLIGLHKFFSKEIIDGHFDIKMVEKHNSLQRGMGNRIATN
jgi:trans-2,3-dihydro-3-hydroxyanthranilate isomerase